MSSFLLPFRLAVASGAVLLVTAGITSAADVQQYILLKGNLFLQTSTGAPVPNGGLPFVLQCQADASSPNVLTNMSFTPPGGVAQNVSPDGDRGYSFKQAFASLSALNAGFPNGTYSLTMKSVNDGIRTVSLALNGDIYPSTPHISNFTSAQDVDPNADFTLTWDALNGTVNDYVEFSLRDGGGQDVFRSADFGQPAALNGTSTSVTIPARRLRPGQTYQAELLIAQGLQSPDTTSYPGATGIASYFKRLNFNLVTRGTQTGPAVGQFTLVFSFYAGTFSETNGTISFPQPLGYYFALYNVDNDVNYPASVVFTGPGGSGLTNATSQVNGSSFGTSAFYSSPQVNFSSNNLPQGAFYSPTQPPGGVYTVNYKGTNQQFNLLDPLSANQQVLLVPTVVLTSTNTIQSIRWTYKSSAGATLPPQPFMDRIQIRINGTTGGRVYDGGLDYNNLILAGTTNHTVTANVAWTNVSSIQMVFIDTVGNQYVSYWDQAPQPLQVTTASLPNATQGTPYSFLLSSQGGRQPVSWAIDSGFLPSGLFLNFGTGELLGTPGENGAFPVTFRATDQQNSVTNRTLTLTVNPGTFPAPGFTNAALNGSRQLIGQLLTVGGQTYTIEASTNLVNWFVRDTLFATNSVMPVLDPDAVARFPRLFYRLRIGRVFSATLNFHFYANAGNFGAGLTPTTAFPVALNSYTANLDVENTRSNAPAANVLFTGPGGSGLSAAAAVAQNSFIGPDEARYQSPGVSNPVNPPTGTWTVSYHGTNLTFTPPAAQATSRLVIPFPTVTVTSGNLTAVSWVYKDAATGSTLGQPPGYLTDLQVQVDVQGQGRVYDSPNVSSGTTSVSGINGVVWSNVVNLYLVYNDTLGNHYVVSYQKP